MSIADVLDRQRLEAERALRARMALGVKMLTNAGYALIGGTFFKAVAEQRPIPATSYLWAGAGVVALGLALFFAPDGASLGE
jgi:hypothetical protein